ncbi:MAG: hypothetical protein JEZ07_12175 [Phycisphaerae bacterium]|nr:hypothetical protein [Phycisphaerae bacterium]
MIRITDTALAFDHKEQLLIQRIIKLLGIKPADMLSYTIIRRAIDARHKSNIMAVYTIDVAVIDEAAILAKFDANPKIKPAPDMQYQMPQAVKPAEKPPIVVGSGPCGLFIALLLAQLGLKPIMIERGKDVQSRIADINRFWRDGILDTESNVQFGEGGAGTFSDGKLTTQIKDKLNRSRKVLTEFVKAGAPEEILYQAKPHIGTDNLIRIIKNIRQEIINLGGQVRFQTQLTGIETANGHITAAIVNDNETIPTDAIALALGHSARDTFEMLHAAGIAIEAKPFAIGVRIEHPQSIIDKAQYGKFAGHPSLGAAEYKLVHHCANGRSTYTFCMCPGGKVIASSSEAGHLVTNGMSYYKRNCDNANSALLVGIKVEDFPSDHPLAGIEFQRQWEAAAYRLGGSNYHAPIQLVGDFLAHRPSTVIGTVKPSYAPGITPCDLAGCLPEYIIKTIREALPQLDKKLKGFAMADAVMTAIESRSSAPLRILRDKETLQSVTTKGLFPAGEGAGYAGGIISAAIDGIKIAEAITNLSD